MKKIKTMEKEQKLITVYFIDAQNMSCKLMEIENNLETFYKLINTDSIQIVARIINGKMTQIICDEEGKLKENQLISASSSDFKETLVGNLIIKSEDRQIPMIVKKYGVLVYDLRKDCKPNDNKKRNKRYN